MRNANTPLNHPKCSLSLGRAHVLFKQVSVDVVSLTMTRVTRNIRFDRHPSTSSTTVRTISRQRAAVGARYLCLVVLLISLYIVMHCNEMSCEQMKMEVDRKRKFDHRQDLLRKQGACLQCESKKCYPWGRLRITPHISVC